MDKSKLVEKFTKGWSHFCNHINFADSNLDAESIQFMNEMPGCLCSSHDALVEALEAMQKAWTQPTRRSMDQLKTDMDNACKQAGQVLADAQ